MIKIQLLICKLASFILKLLGRGSNYPGVLALKLNKNIGSYFKMPKIVVAVTGSAGKGSTSTIIEDTLRKENMKVVHNKFGSNMLPGILSLLIANCNLNGKIKGDALVVEVDERYTKVVFDIVKPQYVVVTNICRDQPPRHGHFDLVLNRAKDSKCYINAENKEEHTNTNVNLSNNKFQENFQKNNWILQCFY